MYFNEKRIREGEIADSFATYFEEKVGKIVKNATIDHGVYNGRRKMVAADSNFMSQDDILVCVKQMCDDLSINKYFELN